MTAEVTFLMPEAQQGRRTMSSGAASLGNEANGTISVEVASRFQDLSLNESGWDEAAALLGGPVYMTYGWLETWWKFYGRGHELRLFVARRGEQIVGLVPVYIERFGLTSCFARVARVVGASLPPKTFDPPVDAEDAAMVFKFVFSTLFGRDRCDVISMGPVSQSWAGSAGLRLAAEASGSAVGRIVHLVRDVHTMFELPNSFEDYLGSLGSGERKNRMKRLRQLEKGRELRADVVHEPAESAQAFEEFAALHARQWARVGKGGHFEAWPDALEFNRELTERQAARGRVRFFRLFADQEVISSRYTFHFAGTIFSELPARAVGDPWDKLGVGGSSMIKFNEALIAGGYQRVDSGLGGYDHKTQLGGEEVPVGVWRLTRASSLSRVRSRLLEGLSFIFTIVFQKLWYRRIVPKLPGKWGRTQRRFWLKYSF